MQPSEIARGCTCGHGQPHHRSGIRPGRCFACDCARYRPAASADEPAVLLELPDGHQLPVRAAPLRLAKAMPAWAARLTVAVCDAYGVKPPQVTWHVSRDGLGRSFHVHVAASDVVEAMRRLTRSGYWWKLEDGANTTANYRVIRYRRPRRANRYSSGRCGSFRLHLTAGTDVTDQKLVLLHELGHWLGFRGIGGAKHHNDAFWALAFDLYERFGPAQGFGDPAFDMAYAHDRERDYRKGAVKEAARRRLSGPSDG